MHLLLIECASGQAVILPIDTLERGAAVSRALTMLTDPALPFLSRGAKAEALSARVVEVIADLPVGEWRR
jgi:hypothetical protein